MSRRGMIRLAALWALTTAGIVASAPVPSTAQTLPTGFALQPVVLGPFVSFPAGFTFLPDGRIVLVEQVDGIVRLAPAPGASSVTSVPILTIPNVSTAPERGLLGVAVDPDWPTRPYLYFHFTHTSGTIHIVQYTASGALADPSSTNLTLGSPFVLLDDIPDVFDNHNGGTLRFGPDGFLYVSLGDDSQSCQAQVRSQLLGKILRLDISQMPGAGTGPPPHADITPADNPYPGPDPHERLLWAHGFRNPFRFTIDAATNDLFVGDVGLNTWEEIDVIPFAGHAGANYGWPEFEGPLQDPEPGAANCSTGPFLNPIYVYPNPPGPSVAAVIGGPLYRPNPHSTRSFPRAYEESLFLCEFYSGWIRRLVRGPSGWQLATPVPGQPTAENWASNLGNVSDLQLGADGALYMLAMFGAGNVATGLHRIVNTLPSDVGDLTGLGAAAQFLPNPTHPGRGGRFVVSIAATAGLDVHIYDPRGRLVRTLRAAAPTPGAASTCTWDGRNARGSIVAAGSYFYEVAAPSGGRTRGKISIVPRAAP